jgi:hypothetical protein
MCDVQQQLITNQKNRQLEDGMEIIQANITLAQEQMVRQAQEVDASFEQALRESETELEGMMGRVFSLITCMVASMDGSFQCFSGKHS